MERQTPFTAGPTKEEKEERKKKSKVMDKIVVAVGPEDSDQQTHQ